MNKCEYLDFVYAQLNVYTAKFCNYIYVNFRLTQDIVREFIVFENKVHVRYM